MPTKHSTAPKTGRSCSKTNWTTWGMTLWSGPSPTRFNEDSSHDLNWTRMLLRSRLNSHQGRWVCLLLAASSSKVSATKSKTIWKINTRATSRAWSRKATTRFHRIARIARESRRAYSNKLNGRRRPRTTTKTLTIRVSKFKSTTSQITLARTLDKVGTSKGLGRNMRTVPRKNDLFIF